MILEVADFSNGTRLGIALERSQQERLQDKLEASFCGGVGVGRSVLAFFGGSTVQTASELEERNRFFFVKKLVIGGIAKFQ